MMWRRLPGSRTFHQARVIFMESALKINSKKWALHKKDFRGLRVILNLLISNVYDRNKTLKTIIPQLKSMGISSCYIYLYENSYVHGRTDRWKFPRNIKLSMSYGHPELAENCENRNDSYKEYIEKELFTAENATRPLFFRCFTWRSSLGSWCGNRLY